MFVLLYVLCMCVSLCRCSFVCVRHSIFYVCVTYCDLDVTMRRHYKKSERRREGITTTSRMYHPKERRNKIRNLWLWLVCCSLLPTCNFHHRPFTLVVVKTSHFKSRRQDGRKRSLPCNPLHHWSNKSQEFSGTSVL